VTAYALITGVIFRAPQQRTSKAGKLYTVCTVKVGSDDTASAQLELLRLEVGDSVAARGKMKLELFEGRISRSIFADAALGLRPAPRTPKTRAAKAAPTSQEQTIAAPPFDDGVPFAPEFR
jgi:hypothetical protein